MFERFTEKAIKVIMLAQEEARRLGHNFVGVEFIFLGLIGEATGIAAKVLRQQGITLKNARIEVEKILGRGSGMITVEPPFTESAKLVLNGALSFAEQLGSESINTEHLLIGIFQEGESTARILQNLRVNPQDLAVSLNQYFQQQPSNQLHQIVYVLLYNAGTDNEGIHTVKMGSKDTILLFESSQDANNYARQLREQNFPMPSVDTIEAKTIISFCKEVGYDWEFVPDGKTITPPTQRVGNETPKKIKPEDYQIFLDNVLQLSSLVDKNRFNPEAVYTLCQSNLDKLDENFGKFIYQWATNIFSNLYPQEAQSVAAIVLMFGNLINEFPFGSVKNNLEISIQAYKSALIVYKPKTFPVYWAMTQMNMGNVYAKRIEGKRTENIEKAIDCFQEALKVYTLDAFPYEWAMTQHNLANAYRDRIRGEKAENLEMAIACCEEALKVRTFETSPNKWAKTQINLANAYCDRIRGEKAENLEMAITYYREALKVFTFDEFPKDWADIQNNLALAYTKRIRDDRAKNLEQAIFHCQEALKVRTLEAFPQDWTMTQNNLANAYRDRIRGDKAENLEMAIAYYRNALKVYTFDAFPEDWAGTQNNLATAYSKKIRWDNAENLEMVIAAYTEVLKVYTFEAFPQKWAMTQNNLALAYLDIIKGDKAKNLEMAITSCQEALKVYTFDAFPEDWAGTQNILAIAYSNRIEGDKADNLEQAITACQKALKVYTFEAFPQKWAMTQYHLANVYTNRIRDDRAKNLERAITSYYNALKIYTKENYPLNCLDTAWNLGILHYDEKQWKPAIETYNIAIEAVENARLEGLNPHSRQQVLSNNIDVFYRIVQAYLNLNQPEKALEYIERSKGRNLVELMTQKNLQPQGVSPEIIDQLNELKQRVVNEQIRLQSQSMKQMRSDDNDHLIRYSYLKEYQQELDNFIEREIKPIDPIFSLTQKVERIPFRDIKALTDAETCLLQWYITRDKILAFVVSADGDVKYWQSSKDNVKQLIDTLLNYLQLYYSENGKQEWRNQLSNLLQTFADTLHINDIIALIPNTCKRLIIIPHYFLHILPIHAFPINESQILQDKYDVQYAPSCQLLQITKQRQLNDLTNLFGIQNPTKDLNFTDLEVNIISTLFNQSEIIAKDNATKDTVTTNLKASDSHCHHFSCHGSFNQNNPLESALFLANKEPLTLGEIFELNLKKSRLVVLSACETGLIDLNSISDEYIGLPSGFLFAGSPSVVSSLWTVDDLSTSFLMMKFYEILLDETQDVSVPVALKIAQNWLQNLTVKEFEENLSHPTFKQVLNQLEQQLSFGDFFELEDAIAVKKAMSPHEKPFKNPFYWAAFTATGI